MQLSRFRARWRGIRRTGLRHDLPKAHRLDHCLQNRKLASASDDRIRVPHVCQNRREATVTSGQPQAPRVAADLGTCRLTPCLKRPFGLAAGHWALSSGEGRTPAIPRVRSGSVAVKRLHDCTEPSLDYWPVGISTPYGRRDPPELVGRARYLLKQADPETGRSYTQAEVAATVCLSGHVLPTARPGAVSAPTQGTSRQLLKEE